MAKLLEFVGRSRVMSAVAGIALGLCLSSVEAWANDAVEKDAVDALRSMTSYLSALKSFTVDFDADHEIVDRAGQKLQFSASGTLAVERPGKLFISRRGVLTDGEITFDGKMISLYGKDANVWGQLESPGATIDDAVEEFRVATGIDAAGADFLLSDPYPVFAEELEKGVFVGVGFVEGIECSYLAFRNPLVDWQIWIQTGDNPLPVKYVITSKWVAGSPQYTLRFRNWNVDAKIDAKTFEFAPPSGARKLDEINADELGEILEEK